MSSAGEIDRRHARKLLREMLLVRRFEERCVELYSATKIRGFLHLYIGEEAVAVGAMQALEPDDAVVATYREHGHALVRGVSAESIMAEMFGRVDWIPSERLLDCVRSPVQSLRPLTPQSRTLRDRNLRRVCARCMAMIASSSTISTRINYHWVGGSGTVSSML